VELNATANNPSQQLWFDPAKKPNLAIDFDYRHGRIEPLGLWSASISTIVGEIPNSLSTSCARHTNDNHRV
jgi:hypothetical protein